MLQWVDLAQSLVQAWPWSGAGPALTGTNSKKVSVHRAEVPAGLLTEDHPIEPPGHVAELEGGHDFLMSVRNPRPDNDLDTDVSDTREGQLAVHHVPDCEAKLAKLRWLSLRYSYRGLTI